MTALETPVRPAAGTGTATSRRVRADRRPVNDHSDGDGDGDGDGGQSGPGSVHSPMPTAGLGDTSGVGNRYAYLDHPLPLAFAHRGGAGGGRENTMDAFAQAVQMGYRHVETDVHVTRDGRLVAFHDRTLDRVTDLVGAIGELTWAQVSAAQVGNGGAVPLLAEVLDAWPNLRLNLDVKADEAVEPLVDTVRRTGTIDRLCVGSFSTRRLRRVRAALGPRLATSMGPREVLRLRAGSLLGIGGATSGAACVQVPPRAARLPLVDRRFVAHAHRLGLQVHVWTIDDPVEMNRLLDLGVDGIMTDELATLREVYAARGLWAA
jgi:glycerophosphoryl diester phosphodiesterase